jgi:hypothetical protein
MTIIHLLKKFRRQLERLNVLGTCARSKNANSLSHQVLHGRFSDLKNPNGIKLTALYQPGHLIVLRDTRAVFETKGTLVP